MQNKGEKRKKENTKEKNWGKKTKRVKKVKEKKKKRRKTKL